MKTVPSRVTSVRSSTHFVNGSLSETLGPFYMCMSTAHDHVESGYFGPTDEDGVALTSRGDAEHVYNVTLIAQYALSLIDKILADGPDPDLERKLSAQLDAIVARIECDPPKRGFILIGWDNQKYPWIRAPWVSALTQGNAASALLRGYQLLNDDRLLGAATLAFNALECPVSEGGVLATDTCGHLWFEEYPDDPPMYVLNGFILALWGVLDYARVTGDQKAWDWWNAGVETLKAHIAEFDCGFWSVYDLKYRELCSLYYQLNIHVPQMETMYLLTKDPVFKYYAERWNRFGKSKWRRAVHWTALRADARMRSLKSQQLVRWR